MTSGTRLASDGDEVLPLDVLDEPPLDEALPLDVLDEPLLDEAPPLEDPDDEALPLDRPDPPPADEALLDEPDAPLPVDAPPLDVDEPKLDEPSSVSPPESAAALAPPSSPGRSEMPRIVLHPADAPRPPPGTYVMLRSWPTAVRCCSPASERVAVGLTRSRWPLRTLQQSAASPTTALVAEPVGLCATCSKRATTHGTARASR